MFGKRSTSLGGGGKSFLFSFINGWATRSGRSSSSPIVKASAGADRGKL